MRSGLASRTLFWRIILHIVFSMPFEPKERKARFTMAVSSHVCVCLTFQLFFLFFIALYTTLSPHACAQVRLPLCDQLAHWGYAPRLVGLMKQAIDAGALGTPLVSSLRLIHQIGERPLCIEVLAASTQNLISQLVRLLVPDLHPDTAFVVETMLRLFKFGAGGSAHGYENLVAAALGAQLPNVLMDQVLENPKLQTEVVDPAATKVFVCIFMYTYILGGSEKVHLFLFRHALCSGLVQ